MSVKVYYTPHKFTVVCLILVAMPILHAGGFNAHLSSSSHNDTTKLTTTSTRGILQRPHDLDSAIGRALRADVSMHGTMSVEKPTSMASEKQTEMKDTTGDRVTKNIETETASSEGKEDSDTATGKEGTQEVSTDSGDQVTSEDPQTDSKSPLESMFIEIRKPGRGSPLTETVYKENALDGLFNSCVIDPADTNKQDNTTVCYIDDAYNDRVTFSFTFRFPAAELDSQFETHPPSLEVLGDSSSISEPEILSKAINKQASTGEVSVAYGCKSTSNGTIALALGLHFGQDEDDSISIQWKKECRNQKNDKIELGYLLLEKGSSDTTKHSFPSGESPLVVAPNDLSTEVYIKLGQAGAQQQFLAPYVTSSNPDVTPVTIRGNHPAGGVLQGLEQTTLQVGYDCAAKGESDIALRIGIPPFENLTASWKKDCGGRPATSLQVGTSQNGDDVVTNGKPTSSFQVGIENIGTSHSDEHLHLPGNQSDWTVYITNSDADSSTTTASEAALHVGRITLTVERPNVLAALSPIVSSRGYTGWREQTSPEHIIESGESLKVSFHFLCRALGESRILITVPVLQYDNLEFGIAKECTYIPTAHKARQMVWTVGNVFGGGVVLVVVLFSIWCWRRRQAKGKGFEALPVTER